jgi:hypothetical protein
LLSATLAANVNFGCDKSVELADRGGVKVFAVARELKSGCGVTTEIGVSGYEIANGAGVLVRCAGVVYPSPTFVSSRKDMGFPSGFGLDNGRGLAVDAEEVSIATA